MERKARILDGTRARRLGRHALFASTALSAAVLAAPAHAQSAVAPDTTPTGGVVVGGSSSITQAPGSTTVDQSSQRTAINWQSFNVGANAQVQFNQPSSTAIALNRVVGGDLSQINGKINANGQLVLINQSGVVFGQGAQVNAESVVVSTSNISDKDFMAGHLNFTGAPNPGAKIINEGHITARQAGLVGLVAPQVINSGVITAKLGQVVLAGATAFTLDLYGDRLISLDVTQAVRAVDVNGKKVPALVTNSGVIVADGGRITLTAQDADALVTQLINAGGTIRADTIGSHAGTISVQGIGGDIMIAGNLLARGTSAGSHGGAVEAMATGTVAVAGSADIDVSGQSGGGLVALGTTLARAQGGASYGPAPEAAAVVVAPGAEIHANAIATGNGGTVTQLSSQLTDFQGAVDVRGGSQGGNGGLAEVSSDGVISLGGTVLATAPHGDPGQILLDPDILNVVATATSGIDTGTTAGGTITFGNLMTGSTASNVLTTQLDLLSGKVILEAHSLISVSSTVVMPFATALSLVSLGDISITAGISIAGDLDINAANSLSIDGALSGSDVTLASGTAGTSIDAPVGGGLVLLVGSGTISEGSFVTGGALPATLVGAINTPQLTSDNTTIGGSVLLTNSNSIGSLASLATAGSLGLQLNDSASLDIIGTVSAPTAAISAASITVTGSLAIANALALASTNGISEAGGISAASLSSGGTAIGGDVSLTGTNTIATLAGFTLSGSHTLDFLDKTTLGVTGPVVAPVVTLSAPSIAISGHISAASTLALESTGGISEATGGSITTGSLTSGGTTIGGDVLLTNGFNQVGTLAGFSVAAGHTLALDDIGLLTVAGPVTAGSVILAANNITIPGALSAAAVLALETAGSITETGSIRAGTLTSGGTTIGSGNTVGSGALFTGSNTIATLGNFTVATGSGFVLQDTGSLNVAGTVNAPAVTISSGSIGIGGSLSIGNALVLESLGSIAETGGITAATLSSGGTTIGGNVVLAGTNTIATLADFTVGSGGLLDLADTGLLTVAGPVTAPVVSLSAATLDITGDINAATSLALGSSGTIQQVGTAGSIVTGALVSIGSIDGDVLLDAAGNSISSLGNFTLGGTLDLSTATGLDVYGVVGAPGLVDLSGTSLTESGAGALDVATLTSSGYLAGSVALGGANNIGTLMNISADGNVAVFNAGSIDILDRLGGANVTVVAPSIGLNGYIVAGSTIDPGTLALAANQINVGTYTNNSVMFNSALYVPYGTIEIAPYTSGKAIDIGSLAANDLDILPSLTSIIDTYRSPDDLVIGEAAGRYAGAITIDNSTSLGIGVVDLAMPAPAGSFSSVIQDNGTLSVANLLDFSGGGFLQSPNGELEAALLRGDGGTITGPVSLTSALNQIGALGSVTLPDTADLALTDATELFADGPVSARNITLSAVNMETDGSLTAAEGGTINLIGDTITNGGGALSAPDGLVAFAPYTDGRDIDFSGGGSYYDLRLDPGFGTLVNAEVLQVGTAAGHYGGTLDVGGPLTIAAPTLALSGTAITFSSTLTEPGLVTFNSPGYVTESSGAVITAGTIGGNGGTIGLLGGNSIGTLGNLTAQTNLAIGNTPSLIIAGTVSALGTTAGTGIVTLEDAGAITETTGAIIARSLDTGGTALGGDLILGNANSIAALGAVTLGTHTLVLNENQTLTVNGPVSAGNATFTTPGMTIAGSLSVTNTLAFGGAGGVDETTGLVTAGSLVSAGTIGGDIALGNANSIATVGGFTVAADHSFDLHDAGLLTVAGPLVAPSTTLSAGSIALAGDVDAAMLLALQSTGGITQSAGVISTGQLTTGGTSVGGDLRLFDGNAITSVGSVTVAAGHTFAVNDAVPLTVAGPVNAPVVTLSGGGIAITGTVNAPGSLALRSTAGITEPGGVIQTAELTSDGTTIGGAAALLGNNSITALGSFTAPNFALNNTGDLLINGLVTAPGTLTLQGGGNINETTGGTIVAGTLNSGGTTIAGNLGLQNANSIGATGDIALNGNFLLNNTPSLSIAGLLTTPNDVTINAHDIVETNGSISATEFTGNAGGSILLGNPNSISTLGPVLAGGDILLNNVVNLAIAGTVNTPGTLTLQGAGNMTETTGTISAGTLDSIGAINGDIALGNANSIATVGGFTVAAGHSFDLHDAGLLTVAGPLVAPSTTLSAGSIALAGDVDAAMLLALQSTGGITQSAGVISTGQLTTGGTSVGGDLRLFDGNAITSVGSVTVAAGHTFAVNDAVPLTVAGPVNAPVVTLSGGGIAITGTVNAPGSLALRSTAGITEPGGVIQTAELTSDGTTIGGAAALLGNNSITALGSFTAPNFALNNTGDLLINGLVTAPGTLTLQGGGNINETTGGTIVAGTLNSGGTTIAGNLGLQNANSIGATGDIALNGNFLLDNTPSLSIAGLLTTPNDVTINAHDIVETSGSISATEFTGNAGGSILLGNPNSISTLGPVLAGGDILLNNVVNLAIAGTVNTPGTLTLQGAGNMTETTGTISAGTLDSNGAINGDIALGNANSIATVGGFAVAAGHSLYINDSGALGLAGPITAPTATFSAGTIGISGGVDVDGLLAFESTGNVAETTGVITAGTLSSNGTDIGGNVSLNNGNDIATLGGFSANGGMTLDDQAPLQITGNVSLGGALALSGSGDINQTGGSIITAALFSDSGVDGVVSLQQPGNVIPVLGGFGAADGLNLNDTGPLALTGDIFTGADALNLAASGAITQQGGIITAGLVNATAPEITLGDANAIGDLGAVSTDHLLANGVAAITGPVIANNATVTSPGDLALSGPVSVSNALILSAAGNLTQSAGTGLVNASTATFSAAAMNLAGSTDIGGLLDLELPNGNIIHTAGLLQAGTLTGHAGSLASFTGATDFATLGSFFMQDSLFVLHNSGPLVFVGPLLASAVSITVQGLLTLDGTDNGGLFITGGIEPSTATVPTLNDSVIDVVPGPDGGQPQIVQTGTFFINDGPNAATYLGSKTPQATLFMSATPDGSIAFAPSPPVTDGLDGPDIDAILDVGTGGTISGNVNLYRIVILNANAVDLSGTLDNVTGSQGAGKGFVNPFPVPNFRFNACPIGSVNCTILPIESLPSADPLQNFFIDERKKRRLNHNVQLPGIATRDF